MSLSRVKIEGYMFPAKRNKYYDKDAVDAFLSELAADADETLTELEHSRSRIRELEKREESIAQALVMVKQLSEQIVSKAKVEAEKIIMESTARQMELEEEVSRLETVRNRYRADMENDIKELMNKFLKEVRGAEADGE